MLQLRLGKKLHSACRTGYQLVITDTRSALSRLPIEVLGWVEKRGGNRYGKSSTVSLKISRLEYWLSKGVCVHPSVASVLHHSVEVRF
jgi:ribosomal protein S16